MPSWRFNCVLKCLEFKFISGRTVSLLPIYFYPFGFQFMFFPMFFIILKFQTFFEDPDYNPNCRFRSSSQPFSIKTKMPNVKKGAPIWGGICFCWRLTALCTGVSGRDGWGWWDMKFDYRTPLFFQRIFNFLLLGDVAGDWRCPWTRKYYCQAQVSDPNKSHQRWNVVRMHVLRGYKPQLLQNPQLQTEPALGW